MKREQSSRMIRFAAVVAILLSVSVCVDAFHNVHPVSRWQRVSASARSSSATHLYSTTTTTASTDLPLNVARMVQPSVALVTPMGVRNSTNRGTGFVVDFEGDDTTDSMYLLSAAHVAVAPGYQIESVVSKS